MDKMPPATFHILLALAGSDLHGYGIMREVQTATGGTVRIGPGTLYAAIQRLLDDGLIVEAESKVDPDIDDERRRYYRLTREGRRALAAEAARLRDLVRLAQSKGVLPARS